MQFLQFFLGAARSHAKNERNQRRTARKRKVEEACQISDYEESQEAILSNIGNFVETSSCEANEPTSSSGYESSAAVPVYTESSCQTMSLPMMSIENFINDSEGLMFYTGLATYTDFFTCVV